MDRCAAGFPQQPDESVLRIYTTRADTLFGATYMVIAPEHPLLERLTVPEQAAAVAEYCQRAARKSDLDRTDLAKEKTGVFTGSYAINPVNGEAIPIWVADYVLISYGTGAIMAVPAHDTRDFDFAKQFALPIRAVVDPSDAPGALREDLLAGRVAFIADGTAVNSGPYDGLPTAEFKKRIVADLQSQGQGRPAVNYKLRDWLFSRQHFWGEPFPLLHELDAEGRPTGRIRALRPRTCRSICPLRWPSTPGTIAPNRRWRRPRRTGSTSPSTASATSGRPTRCRNGPAPAGITSAFSIRTTPAPIDPAIEKAWMPVDLYVGGAEHAVLHLLYARFWHKVLFDRGYVSTLEPFQKLVNQGMILGNGVHRYRRDWTGCRPMADASGTRESGGQKGARVCTT